LGFIHVRLSNYFLKDFKFVPSLELQKIIISDRCYGICCRLASRGELEVRFIVGGSIQSEAYLLLIHGV
jgi:hypothetical protein